MGISLPLKSLIIASMLGALYSPLFAQTIDLSGKVTDESAAPLTGVAIKLMNSGKSAVSDNNGAYRLTSAAVINPRELAGLRPIGDAVRIEGTDLRISLVKSQRVTVDCIALTGRTIGRIYNGFAEKGTTTLHLSKALTAGRSSSMMMLVTSIGSRKFVRTIIPGIGVVKNPGYDGAAAGGSPFQKFVADTIADTLQFVKSGFDTVKICVPKLVDLLPVVRMTTTTGYPRMVVNTDSIFLTIYKPDPVKGYCRSPRFDWSGIIGRVQYKGHTWFADYAVPHDPMQEPCGTAGEFGIDSASGYSGTNDFLKIGVGRLKGTGGAYNFRTLYTFADPGVWKILRGKNWLEFSHILANVNGYDYDYVKRITLPDGSGVFTIDYYLKNTGTKSIITDHYCHNMVMTDDKTVAGNYRVAFGFPPSLAQQTSGGAGWGGGTTITADTIVIKGTLTGGDFLWATFGGLTNKVADNSAIVTETGGKAAIKIVGNWTPGKYNFWASPRSVCPEPYLSITMQPGASLQWRDTYTPTVN
jgi:hypothetical protein